MSIPAQFKLTAGVKSKGNIRTRRGSQSFHALVLSIVLLGICLGSGAAGEAEAPGDPGSSTNATLVYLQYREVDYSPLCWEIKVLRGASSAPEPADGGTRVFRGQWVLDRDTNQFLPFAWDIQ